MHIHIYIYMYMYICTYTARKTRAEVLRETFKHQQVHHPPQLCERGFFIDNLLV